MSKAIPALLTTYFGTNHSHLSFRIALANAKALAYTLAAGNSSVLTNFLSIASEVTCP